MRLQASCIVQAANTQNFVKLARSKPDPIDHGHSIYIAGRYRGPEEKHSADKIEMRASMDFKQVPGAHDRRTYVDEAIGVCTWGSKSENSRIRSTATISCSVSAKEVSRPFSSPVIASA